MTISQDSLCAAPATGAELTFCSWQAGWRNVLLRSYKDPLRVDDYTTSTTPDQKIVLVSAGSCDIEGRRGRTWHGATYRTGHIGLVSPREAARLRWHGTEHHHNIQLHLPGAMVAAVANDLFRTRHSGVSALNCLSLIDPAVSATMLALDRAARSGAPDLYAESAAHFLASHLLLRQSMVAARPQAMLDTPALRRLTDYMQVNLARPISLSELADVVGVSRFQLLRIAKRAWGETPQRRLTRLRMELAERLLLSRRMTIVEVALECGYTNSSHFSTAFKRAVGVPPSTLFRTS